MRKLRLERPGVVAGEAAALLDVHLEAPRSLA
jgi:hypothetical protein